MLGKDDFDCWVEVRCAKYFKKVGRPSIPTGVYFRMTMVGYSEGSVFERAIAWRCSESMSLSSCYSTG